MTKNDVANLASYLSISPTLMLATLCKLIDHVAMFTRALCVISVYVPKCLYCSSEQVSFEGIYLILVYIGFKQEVFTNIVL